jgi:hypothetical protein
MSWVGTVIEGIRTAVTTKLTDADLKAMMVQAIMDHQSFLGIDVLQTLKYQFRPYVPSDPTQVDTSLFESASNITINETLKLTNPANAGTIQTKALTLTKELAFMRIRCNKKGVTDFALLAFDVSVDKRNEVPDGNLGSWIVSDQAIAAFGVGEIVDLSSVVAKTFSLKISLSAGAIELTDLLIELYLIPSESLADHLVKLRDTVCAMIYDKLSQRAIENSNAPDTVRATQQMASMYRKRGLGMLDGEGGRVNAKSGMSASIGAQRGHDDSVFQPSVAGVSAKAQGFKPAMVRTVDGVKTVIMNFDTAGWFNFP